MLFNLIALATLAVVASVAPGPTNALSVESHNFVRNSNAARHHAILGKRQSARPRRCRARTTENASSSAAASTGTTSSSSSSSSTTSRAASSSSQTPAPTSTRASSSSTPKPTTSKTTSVAPVPSYYGGKKACVAYAGNVNVPRFVAGSNKIACVTNWSSWKPTWMGQLKDVSFYPQFWGEKQAADFRKNVVRGFSNYVLGMNEPDQTGQAHLSVGDGIRLWYEYLQPLKSQGYTLISPSCTNAPAGTQWMKDFVNGCTSCSIDIMGVHWYGNDQEDFIRHIQMYHSTFGRPLFISEFACHDFSGRNQQCSVDKTFAFMQRTTSFMDNADWVFRYAYFGALPWDRLGGVNGVNRLINDDSSPSALGAKYLGF